MCCEEGIVHFGLIQDPVLFDHLQPHICRIQFEFWNKFERGVLVRCPYVVAVLTTSVTCCEIGKFDDGT